MFVLSDVVILLSRAAPLIGELGEQERESETLLTEPTFFEIVTACALEFFRRKNVEVAVVEVGMGGRWDATNIVPDSWTVITPIGKDHERFLGSTIQEACQASRMASSQVTSAIASLTKPRQNPKAADAMQMATIA